MLQEYMWAAVYRFKFTHEMLHGTDTCERKKEDPWQPQRVSFFGGTKRSGQYNNQLQTILK